MKKLLMTLAILAIAVPAMASDVVLLGVLDGPITGGLPKFIEVFVCNDVADMSIYGLGSANNGGGSNGQEFTFDAVAVSAGTSLFVASDDVQFPVFMGFAPDYVSSAANIYGDDAIELFCDGAVVDIYGEIDVDGTGQPWEYLDSWAKRSSGTGPDGTTFVIGSWTIPGPNVLDGHATNADAEAQGVG